MVTGPLGRIKATRQDRSLSGPISFGPNLDLKQALFIGDSSGNALGLNRVLASYQYSTGIPGLPIMNAQEKVLVTLGDHLIDRQLGSFEILLLTADLRSQLGRVVSILGNHDLALIEIIVAAANGELDPFIREFENLEKKDGKDISFAGIREFGKYVGLDENAYPSQILRRIKTIGAQEFLTCLRKDPSFNKIMEEICRFQLFEVLNFIRYPKSPKDKRNPDASSQPSVNKILAMHTDMTTDVLRILNRRTAESENFEQGIATINQEFQEFLKSLFYQEKIPETGNFPRIYREALTIASWKNRTFHDTDIRIYNKQQAGKVTTPADFNFALDYNEFQKFVNASGVSDVFFGHSYLHEPVIHVGSPDLHMTFHGLDRGNVEFSHYALPGVN